MSENKVQVQVFTTADCAFCKIVKNYLRSQGVEFTEIDLNTNPAAVEWLRLRLKQFGVPVTVFNNSDLVIGWQRQQIDEYLRVYNLTK